ncbi:MAG: cytochrome B [Bacteroidetes bacterium]|nr:cytochrome B [Bacteroidota bacterium]
MSYFLPIHNILRWAILLFGAWTVLNAITGVLGKRNYTASDNRANLLFMIFFDVQLLVGLVLYFYNPWFEQMKSDFSAAMKIPMFRFFGMEHTVMMIIAWLLVHVGRSSVKKAGTDAAKHKRSLIFFGIALLIILMMIPWPGREAGIGRPLFPHT